MEERFICRSAVPFYPWVGLFENCFQINQHLWWQLNWGKLIKAAEQPVRGLAVGIEGSWGYWGSSVHGEVSLIVLSVQ